MITITENEIMKNWQGIYPIVTIRCVTYNHEKYIAQALDGFLNQKTTFPFEVLVHEDASTDNTAKIIREYEEKYPQIIKPIYQTENQWSKHDGSITRILNSLTKGKYIALCEGDDYWIDENKLQMQVDFLENNPEYTMCFHCADFEVIGAHDVPNKLQCIEDRDYSATEILKNWTIPTASVVYKKEILDYPIKNSDRIMFGDIVLFEKCAHLGKIRAFSKKMSIYRIHNQGVSHDKTLINKRRLGFPKHYECIYENFPKIERDVILKKILRSYFVCLIYCGNFVTKINYLKNIFKFSFKLIFFKRKNGR